MSAWACIRYVSVGGCILSLWVIPLQITFLSCLEGQSLHSCVVWLSRSYLAKFVQLLLMVINHQQILFSFSNSRIICLKGGKKQLPFVLKIVFWAHWTLMKDKLLHLLCLSSGERGMLMAGLEGSYCRNPDKDKHGPWCYTNNSAIRWDYCNVKPCECTYMQATQNHT